MKRVYFGIIAFLAILVYSCSPGNEVSVKFSPEGKVDRLTTFQVDFNTDLAPLDKIDQWLDEEYVKFDPPIPGKFKWLDDRTLLFSPEVALEPIQGYKAHITDKVLFDKQLSLSKSEFEFNTSEFDVTKVDFFWTRVPNEKYVLSIQANIYFNYPVNPDRLKDKLDVTIQGKKEDGYKIISEEASDVIAVNLSTISQTKDKQDLTIKVNEGLYSVIGKKPLEDSREFNYELPPITRLAIKGVYSGYQGDKAWIEVQTTQKVDKDKLKDYVEFDPKLDGTFFVNDNAFRFEGNFTNIPSIKLLVKKGLPGLFGGDLEFEYEQLITMANVEPSINFSDQRGKYLMLGGEKNLEVNVVNIPKVEVEVSKIYKNNLVHFLNKYRYSYYYDYYYNPNYYSGNYGDELYRKDVDLDNSQNVVQKLPINLDDVIGSRFQGIYTVSVRSGNQRWIHDNKIVSLSNLAVIAKRSDKEIVVFVNSIESAEPLSGVTVSVISSKNQELFSGKTDEQGVAGFGNVKAELDGASPLLIIAELGEDFNYIDLNETQVETSRFDVGGIPQYSQYYTAYIYGERDLYRPGETAHISGIVRDDKIGLIGDIPLKVKIVSPNGKTFKESKVILNQQGSFELDVPMPDYAQTGEYRLSLYVNSNNLVGNYRYSIEEFVPDKIRVNLTKNKEKVNPGDEIIIKADAEFLFGAKAAGLKYQAIVELDHHNFHSKNYPKYNFTDFSSDNTVFQPSFFEGMLNNNGQVEIKYKTPDKISSKGLVKGTAFVSVFDLTGRTVSRAAMFDINPRDYFIGIRKEGYYYGTNQEINFRIIAVDTNDTALQDFKATIELYKINWQTVLRRDNSNRYRYVSEKQPVKISSKEITLNGETDYTVSVDQSGKYEVHVLKAGSTDYQKVTFYAYNWMRSSSASFQVDKEGRIDLVTDKEVYEPGEEAKLLFTAPFSGKMLLTLERNGIYDYRYVDVSEKSVEVSIPIKEEYMPNFYVSATLFRPHSINNNAPFLVGHGFHSVKVERKSNKLPLAIEAPAKIKSNTKQIIKIKTQPEKNIYITFAAVDEGILQIKNYETPDPYAYMNAKRPLQVKSYDLYKLLLPEILSSSSAAGGMALEMQLKKRINPVKSKRFNLISYWSGIKRSDSDGEVTVELDIPQFNGELRLMAVAYQGSRFGNADKYMKVSESVILEPEIPRVLSSNDKLVSNVSVINTTDESGYIDLAVSVEGPLQVTSKTTKTVKLEPNSTSSTQFEITALNDIGVGKIKFSTSGMVSITSNVEIAVRPVSPLVVESGSGQLKAGESYEIELPKGFLANTQTTSISLSKFPAIKFAKHLKYLVGYPYGCVEQTTSRLFPQLYFEELVKLVEPGLYRTTNPSYYIKEGIRKLESMQLPDGALAYWQGGTYTSWWGSVYAAHFLVEAKKAGFSVDQNVYNNLLRYIEKQVLTRKTYDYVRYQKNRRTVTKITRKEIPYSLYVMALAGKGDISTMNYYKARPHLLSTDSKYLIAGAYAVMDKMSSFEEFLPPEFIPVNTERQTGGSFDSEARANAIMLNVLLDVDPTNDQIPAMVKHLTQLSVRMYSTQERSFAFLALGKAAKQNAGSDMTVQVVAGSEIVATVNNINKTVTDERLNTDKITLNSSGAGSMYYFWDVEGIKIDGEIKEEDNLMKVRREYLDYNTKRKITGGMFDQGQLLICRLTLQGGERSAENVVITDMIPSGFEIENPRLSELKDLSFQSGKKMKIDYLDIRDDRLIIFTDLVRKQTREYDYLIRVVNSGDYALPPVNAEAMYDREFRSVNGSRRITITK